MAFLASVAACCLRGRGKRSRDCTCSTPAVVRSRPVTVCRPGTCSDPDVTGSKPVTTHSPSTRAPVTGSAPAGSCARAPHTASRDRQPG